MGSAGKRSEADTAEHEARQKLHHEIPICRSTSYSSASRFRRRSRCAHVSAKGSRLGALLGHRELKMQRLLKATQVLIEVFSAQQHVQSAESIDRLTNRP